jgi:aromatic-L-amino-acid decarboxylase
VHGLELGDVVDSEEGPDEEERVQPVAEVVALRPGRERVAGLARDLHGRLGARREQQRTSQHLGGRRALDGIGRADSVALDPHKWLFVPFECGCLLAREPRRLRDAFRIVPEYLQDVEASGERVNFADYGEQLTRYARALKVWIGVRYFGVAALRAAMDRAMDLAAHAERLVRAEPILEVTSPARLSVLCFRARPPGAADDPAALDAFNERLNAAVNATGRYFVSSTRLRGAFTLRLCVLGFRTSEEEVEGVIRCVAELARRG